MMFVVNNSIWSKYMFKIRLNKRNFQDFLSFISSTNLFYQANLGRVVITKSDIDKILSFDQNLIPLIPKVGYALFKCKLLLQELLSHNRHYHAIPSDNKVAFEQDI